MSNRNLKKGFRLEKKVDPEILALETDWIEGLFEQVRFAQKNLTIYYVRLDVKRYCDCYPDCFSNVDLDPNLEHNLQQKAKSKKSESEAIAA